MTSKGTTDLVLDLGKGNFVNFPAKHDSQTLEEESEVVLTITAIFATVENLKSH